MQQLKLKQETKDKLKQKKNEIQSRLMRVLMDIPQQLIYIGIFLGLASYAIMIYMVVNGFDVQNYTDSMKYLDFTEVDPLFHYLEMKN